MQTLKEFCDALNAAKKARRLSAVELAERTGLTPQAVRKILSGRSAPLLTNAIALAQELGLRMVIVPAEAAQSLQAAPPAQRSVLSDVERMLPLP